MPPVPPPPPLPLSEATGYPPPPPSVSSGPNVSAGGGGGRGWSSSGGIPVISAPLSPPRSPVKAASSDDELVTTRTFNKSTGRGDRKPKVRRGPPSRAVLRRNSSTSSIGSTYSAVSTVVDLEKLDVAGVRRIGGQGALRCTAVHAVRLGSTSSRGCTGRQAPFSFSVKRATLTGLPPPPVLYPPDCGVVEW